MGDVCYYHGSNPPRNQDWKRVGRLWWRVHDETPLAGGLALNSRRPARRELPGIWLEGEVLFAQRDRAGRYPFAWRKEPRGLFVCSDVEFLHRITSPPDWSSLRVAQAISLYDDPARCDAWLGTHRILPGERVRFSPHSLPRNDTYPIAERSVEGEHLINALDMAISQACCKIPESPTLLLSGGLDSPLLGAFIVDAGKAPNAATLVSKFVSQNEETTVKRLSLLWGMKYRTFEIDDFRPFDNLGPWVDYSYYGIGLYPDSVYMIPFLLAQTAMGSTHFVSGVGADQLFGLSALTLLAQGVDHLDLRACSVAIDSLSERTLLGALASQSRVWRRFRTTPSWAHPEVWLNRRVYTLPVPMLRGWHYEMSMRTLRLMEKAVGVTIYTPFLSPAVIDVVETADPSERLIHAPDKRLLRMVADRHLPKDIAWAPKAGFFTDFWEAKLRERSLDELTERLDVLTTFLPKEALSCSAIDVAMSNTGGTRSCFALANAIIISDVLNAENSRED